MNKKYIEILSPAGTFESITAAVNCGCNAVYLGGKTFNARQYAENFSDNDLKEIIKYCHLRAVKVFITVNTLYKNSEFEELINFICKLYEFGADALIIQDIGLFSLLREKLPDFSLHASTQLTTHNLESALFLESLGFKRIVLSRELSLEEVSEICQKTNTEIECFVHGALCISFSGRCLLSSYIGGRSGNRGRCAQPCRMTYSLLKNEKIIKKGFLLSTKDILTADIIDKLIKAGITSFKIEGRMKSPEYVAKSTAVYRKYANMALSNNFKPNKNDISELLQIFNRGGDSSKGCYDNWGGSNMLSLSPKSSGTKIGKVLRYDYKTKICTIKTDCELHCGDGIEIWTENFPHTGTNISKNISANSEFSIMIDGKIKKDNLVYKSFDKKLNDGIKKLYQKDTAKQKIEVNVIAILGSPLKITMKAANGTTAIYSEDIIETAQNQPMSEDTITRQICKTGSTPFEFVIKKTKIDENIYIPIAKLNNFRRNACNAMQDKLSQGRESVKLNFTVPQIKPSPKTLLSASVLTKEQFDAAVKNGISRIYIPMNDEYVNNINYFVSAAHKNGSQLFFTAPSIIRKNYKSKLKKLFEKTENSEIDGYLVRNYGFPDTSKEIALDYTFNALNSFSIIFLKKYGNTVAVSPETSLAEAESLCGENTELVVYGRLTLMTTHQCPVGIHDGKKKCGQFCKLKNHKEAYALADKTNAVFPVITDCDTCTAFILSSNPICILNKANDFKNIKPQFFRLDFTTENAELTDKVLSMYKAVLADKINIKKDTVKLFTKENDFTNGYFTRGVL